MNKEPFAQLAVDSSSGNLGAFVPYYSPSPTTALLPVKKRDVSFFYVVAFVLALHACCLFFAAGPSKDRRLPKVSERLVVKTVTLQPRHVTQGVHPALIAEVAEPMKEALPTMPENIPQVVKEEPKPEPQKSEPAPVQLKAQMQKKVEESPKPKTPEKKVNHIKKEAVKPAPSAKPAPKPKVAAKPKTVEPKQVKKMPAEAPVVKKPIEEPKIDPVVEARKIKQRELMAKAKASMANMEKDRNKAAAKPAAETSFAQANVPKAIESLQIDAFSTGEAVTLTSREMSYRDELARRLKLGLRLPEYGEVKIKLTLERSGKVTQVQIVSSKNEKNRQYIEKTVPTLIFSDFGDNFEDSQHYTFIVCLNNEV